MISNSSTIDITFVCFFFKDYQQNNQLLHARRSRGRVLPATPNKPSILRIPETDAKFSELNPSPTQVSSKLQRETELLLTMAHSFYPFFSTVNKGNNQ